MEGDLCTTIRGMPGGLLAYPAILLITLMVGTCKPFEPEQLVLIETGAVSGVTYHSCIIDGEVYDAGPGGIDQHGFVWSKEVNPVLENSSSSELGPLNSTGSFSDTISGLVPSTTYFLRAYGIAGQQTTYGKEIYVVTAPPEVPVVETIEVTFITDTSAQSGGKVTSDGGADVMARGVCWDTVPEPTLADSLTVDSTGTGAFTSVVSNLMYNTTYYLRAYATNTAGTGYGDEREFTTGQRKPVVPVVTTEEITGITDTSAVCGGNVTDEGGLPVTARGICWAITQNPTVEDNHTMDGSGAGTFTSEITDLNYNTTYYVRAYATNSVGTGYGEEREFTTEPRQPVLPVLSTSSVSSVTDSSAISGGTITDNGGSTITARGVCWNQSGSPDTTDQHTFDGTGAGSFSSSLSGLECGTTYHVRAYATNSVGIAYGDEITFISADCPVLPTVVTVAATEVTESAATCGGNVTNDGGAMITARGVCWSLQPDPTVDSSHTTDGPGSGIFSSHLSDLDHLTTYYYAAYATNAVGTSYGEVLELTTLDLPGFVTDIDRNSYPIVTIGSQVWMAEHLKVTRFANGQPIPHVESASAWVDLTTYDMAYCWHGNSEANRDIYGGLYTWAAAMNGASNTDANPSGVQGICPDGWHLPSDSEWKELEIYLGMSEDDTKKWSDRGTNEGGKLKEAGILRWNDPNTGATNESGFTALPASVRVYTGDFGTLGMNTIIWTTTQDGPERALYRSLMYNSAGISRNSYFRDNGYSVRCLKD